MRLSLAVSVVLGLAAGSAYAQQVISAHSGVIQLVQGKAYLNDKVVETKFGQFPDIKNGQELRTEEGRAEVLLTPGVFLRMGENSSIKMVSNLLTDTRVEVLKGSAMVECDEVPKDNSIELLYKDNTMMLVKHGLYRVDTDPARVQVYDGEAVVKAESGQLTLRGGKQTSLSGVLMAENFDKKTTDELYSWSVRRADYLTTANASSAMTMRNSGYSSGTFGNSFYSGLGTGGFSGYSGWQFNPMFGMFTYVPMDGFGYSPFGFGWWSPATIGYYVPATSGGIASSRFTPPLGSAASNRSGSYPLASPSNSGGTASGGSLAGRAGGGGMAASHGGGHR